jgi:hypothetical protein
MENKNLKGRICKACNKPLKVIGITRKNGNNDFIDKPNRMYHKRCYKDVLALNSVKQMIENIEKKILYHNSINLHDV